MALDLFRTILPGFALVGRWLRARSRCSQPAVGFFFSPFRTGKGGFGPPGPLSRFPFHRRFADAIFEWRVAEFLETSLVHRETQRHAGIDVVTVEAPMAVRSAGPQRAAFPSAR